MSASTKGVLPESTAATASDGPKLRRWQERKLSPTRGLIFLGAAVGAPLIALLNFEVVGHLLAEVVILVLEIAEELLDTLLEVVGMGPGSAQMLTAYIGAFLLALLLFFVYRKSATWSRNAKNMLADYREMYADLLKERGNDALGKFIAWWGALNWIGKAGVVIFVLLVVIPLLFGLSVGVGMLIGLLI